MQDDQQGKRRIIFIIDGLEFGGGERLFAQIINALPSESYHVLVASFRNETFYQAVHSSVAKFIEADFSKRLNFSLIPKLAKIIKNNKVDIVIGQGARVEFYARLAKRLAGRSKYISVIQMPVDGFNVNSINKKIYSSLDNFSERYVDRFIVVSDALKEIIIRQHHIKRSKVVKIFNGVEVNHYFPRNSYGSRRRLRAEYGVENETFFIGGIGRLVWQKGFEYLIRALPEIIKTKIQTKLLIIGEGPFQKNLETIAERLKVKDHVIFGGFRADIKEILSAIDLLVVPSLLEGFPMIILEAMAMAKPIIASNLEGILEQIEHSKTGVIVPKRDSRAISREIINLIKNEEKTEKLGQNAREHALEYFTIERMITKTEKVYEDLLNDESLVKYE